MTQRQLRVFQARRHGEGKLVHLKAQLDIVRVDSPVAAAHPRCEIGCGSGACRAADERRCLRIGAGGPLGDVLSARKILIGRAVTTGGLAGEDHACNTAGRHEPGG